MYSKILLFAWCLLVTSSISAQINKGAVLIGGNLGFYTQKNEPYNSKSNSFNISPSVGKVIKDNLVVGIDFSFYGNSTHSLDNLYWTKINSYGGGIFARKYMVLGKKIYLFGQGNISGSYFTENALSNNQGSDGSGYSVNLGIYPGMSYAVTNKILLEAGLFNLFGIGYSSRKTNYDNNPVVAKSRSFGASTSLNAGYPLNIGMRILLNGKGNK